MPNDPTTSNPVPEEPSSAGKPARWRIPALPRLAVNTAAAVAILAFGVGAVATRHWHGGPTAAYASLPAVAIAAMPDGSTIEIKGQVAEIFGDKFVLQDASGRALVETGRPNEDASLVAKDEAVTVQGRFEHGFVHAAFIVHGDGRIVALQPPHGPPHGPLGWLRDHRGGANSSLVAPRPAA